MSRTLGLFATVVLVVRAAVADPVDETTAHEPPSNSLLTALSPMLARWIESSRDAAIAQGVEKIPESIRASLAGYVPDKTLAHVRWRAGGAGPDCVIFDDLSKGRIEAPSTSAGRRPKINACS